MKSTIHIAELGTQQGCRLAFNRLLKMSDDDLAEQDIAVSNLLCATDLPGSENLNIHRCLATIDQWTAYVRDETAKGFPRYLRNPNPNKGSENVYRLWALMYAIRNAYGLEQRIAASKDGFYRDPDTKPTGGPYESSINSETSFIHGVLGPKCLGSCGTSAVIFAAVARRLGYPVKLVLSVQHIFNRWVSPTESFNMDGSMSSIGGDDYVHYIDRQRKWRPQEHTCGALLRPITPREELAAFVFMRSICLSANLRFDEAYDTCMIASQLSPEHPGYAEELGVIRGYQATKKMRSAISIIPSKNYAMMYSVGPIWNVQLRHPNT